MITWPSKPQDLCAIDYLVPDVEQRTRLLLLEKRRRAHIMADCATYPRYQSWIRRRCDLSTEFFFDTFVWTYDPRDLQHYPMVLWPIQRKYIQFVEAAIEAQQDWACQKSRDMGATYLNGGIAIKYWLLRYGFKSSFCANKSNLVDELGNPDTIFEKMRMIMAALPYWLKPDGFDPGRHLMLNRFVNPANGNTHHRRGRHFGGSRRPLDGLLFG